MFPFVLPKHPETVGEKELRMPLGEILARVMLGAWGVISRSSSRLPVWRRRLLAAVACGALPLPGWRASSGSAWGQAAVTLPEVTVTAPKETTPKPARRPAPAAARPAARRRPACPP